jgi:WD40 repeat protein
MILWDVATGEPLETYLGEAGRILSAVFLDGQRAVSSASTGNLRVWDLGDVKIQKQVVLADEFAASFARSHDGRLGAVGLTEEIQIWNLQTGEILGHLPLPQGVLTGPPEDPHNSGLPPTISALAFNPAGDKLLAAISSNVDGAVILWDLDTGREVRRYEEHSAWIHDLAFSPDGGQFLSASDDKTMILWDVESSEAVHRFVSPTDAISSAAFSPDGKLLAGGFGTYRYPAEGEYLDHNIHLWDAATGEEILQMVGHEGAVTALQFSPDGQKLLSGSIDETVRLWDVATGEEVRRFDGHTGGVFAVAFSPDGRYAASGAQDGSAIVWRVDTGDLLRQLAGHEGVVLYVEFDEGGESLWSAAEDSRLLLWNLSLQLDELLDWTEANRFVPEFTCNQRAQYRIEPLCAR